MIGTVRSTMGRRLASLVLASFLVSFGPPPAPGARSGPPDCMEHHPAAGAMSAHHPSHDADCAGAPGQDCLTMPGCTAAVAVLALTTPAPFAAPAPHEVATAQAPSFHELDALGPPTPPPNS